MICSGIIGKYTSKNFSISFMWEFFTSTKRFENDSLGSEFDCPPRLIEDRTSVNRR
jgi:hypothetical protein